MSEIVLFIKGFWTAPSFSLDVKESYSERLGTVIDFVSTQLSNALSLAKRNAWACQGLGKSKHEKPCSESWQPNSKIWLE